jgi:hypothetical protein
MVVVAVTAREQRERRHDEQEGRRGREHAAAGWHAPAYISPASPNKRTDRAKYSTLVRDRSVTTRVHRTEVVIVAEIWTQVDSRTERRSANQR